MTTSSRTGAKFEIDLVNYIREHRGNAERLTKSGKNDQGDGYSLIDLDAYLMWEAKAEKRIDLPTYLKELEIERANFIRARNLEESQVRGIVIVKRRMAPIAKSYVVQTLDNYIGESSD